MRLSDCEPVKPPTHHHQSLDKNTFHCIQLFVLVSARFCGAAQSAAVHHCVKEPALRGRMKTRPVFSWPAGEEEEEVEEGKAQLGVLGVTGSPGVKVRFAYLVG